MKELCNLFIRVVLSFSLIFTPSFANLPPITPDGQTNTTTDVSSEHNIPVVNIAKPSDGGVSYNTYTNFNVDANGIIINNSTQIGTTNLGGQLYANPNFGTGNAADIILNEVTTNSTSTLLGPTEIFGKTAEFILANPNGITCNGCGFINTSRLGLITGTPHLDSNGNIQNFTMPNEDQGMIYAIVQTPPGSTLEATFAITEEMQKVIKRVKGVDSVSCLAGFEILTEGRGSNAGTCFINLEEWSERSKNVEQIIKELEHKTRNIGAIIEYFEPPAVPGYGAAGGISFRMLDRTNIIDYTTFDKINKEFINKLRKRPELTGLFTFYSASFPQYELQVDVNQAMQKEISISKAMENLDIIIGSTYDQGFVRFGQFFKVYVQSLPEFRALPSDVLNFYTKNEKDELVPYSSFIKMKKHKAQMKSHGLIYTTPPQLEPCPQKAIQQEMPSTP